tara:strand:- start:454 stop:969 length:516 start_codon:yes stop_codon:yes gene_type:complete
MNELIAANYENLIFEFRGLKVMIDADLAALYETETKALKQQVKRNIDRFPIDFMFELTKEEKEQLVTNCDRLKNLKHSSASPYVFTEQGVAMLSSVLRSAKAIAINIEIVRAFAKYRAMLLEHGEMKKELKQLDNKIDQVFKYLVNKIDKLHKAKENDKPNRIGYKYYNDE